MILFKNTRVEPKIPYYKKQYFKFDYVNDLYYLDIFFIYNDFTEIQNLFLILKYYTLHSKLWVKNIYTVMRELDKRSVFLQGLNYRRIQTGNYHDFSKYYNEFSSKDEHYLNEKTPYGIRVIFFKNSPDIQNGIWFPEYPWEKKALDALIGTHLNISEEIKRLKALASKERYLRLKYFTAYINVVRNRRLRKKIH